MGIGQTMVPNAVSAARARSVPRRHLFDVLSDAGGRRVTLVSAPAGSGKTILLRSWIADAGLHDRAAWVSVDRGEQDAQRFWLSVIEGLRAAVGTDAFVDKLAPAPDFDGGAVIARLVSELGSLEEPVVLVVDDLHELHSPEALAQLEFLLARLPRLLHVVLATRHDPQLGLHRLRLAGELTELRAADLRFTLEETHELLAGSGIALSVESIGLLHSYTEGWAAGLRLAAISLAGHPEPERFVAEFSGSERRVADYFLAEVLARQPEDVRRLLLKTSVLERVNGPLADELVGASGSERILVALEDANAFVVSLDASRSWFRYHHLFADLLRLELRRTEPNAVAVLHGAAAQWYAEHGHAVDAVRHAQAARDWSYATRLLVDHSFSLSLDGQEATVGELLAGFPADVASGPELAAVFANNQLARGSLDDAAAYIALADSRIAEVPDKRRRDRLEVALAVARLSLARRRGDLSSVLDAAQPLLERAETQALSDVELGNDVRAVALMNLGIVELWAYRVEEAKRTLAQGIELARRIGRPYVEVACLSALAPISESFGLARKRCEDAIAIAEAHGWGSDAIIGVALVTRGGVDVHQGRFDEAEGWLRRAELALRPELEPATALLLHLTRGMLCIGYGQLEQAIVELGAAERLQAELVAPHSWLVQTREFLVNVYVRQGDMAAARAKLAELSDEDREWGEGRVALTTVHLADGAAAAALDVLAPVVAGSTPVIRDFTVIQALLLDAVAHDLLGERQAAESDVERALEVAEPEANVLPFVMTRARDLLEAHPRHRTAHATLLRDILDVFAGSSLPARAGEQLPLRDDLSQSEQRVLRYLPSNLSAPEIGKELYLSENTVKTHMRHIYTKLGVHRRTEAVERARELRLLSPSRRYR